MYVSVLLNKNQNPSISSFVAEDALKFHEVE